MGLHRPGTRVANGALELERVRDAAPRVIYGGYPLRHEVVEVRQRVGGAVHKYPPSVSRQRGDRTRSIRDVRVGLDLHDEPASRRTDGRESLDRRAIRGRAL